jgi:hypothetical protein
VFSALRINEGGRFSQSRETRQAYKRRSEETRDPHQTYPLRSPHRSPAPALPFDDAPPVAPDIECARLRPTTACVSPYPLETRTSAGTAAVVVAVVLGITKYRPIARRTAPFAALAMPLSSMAGVAMGPRLNAGERFLYCMFIYTGHETESEGSGEGGRGGTVMGMGRPK